MEPITAMILAGGLGTRLRPVVGNSAKALATVDDRTFLDLILDRLRQLGVARVVLLTGFDAEAVEVAAMAHASDAFAIDCSRESEPLGTAGAIRNASALVPGRPFIVINGDTWVDFDPAAVIDRHCDVGADFTLCVIHEDDCSDYGTVRSDPSGRVLRFDEKQPGAGDVNAGIYVLSASLVDAIDIGRPVSLEHEFLPNLLSEGRAVFSHRLNGPMFDIGTPERLGIFRDAVASGDIA